MGISYGKKKAYTFIPFFPKTEKRSKSIYQFLKAKQGFADIERKIAELLKEVKWNHQIRQKIQEIGVKNESRYENAKVVLKQTDNNRLQQFWAKVKH